MMPWTYKLTRRVATPEAGPGIGLAEWVGFVGSDPQLRLTQSRLVRPQAERLSAALWRGDGGDQAVFEWLAGSVLVERPGVEALSKMHAMGAELRAHVEDEEGGWYDRRGHFLGHLAAG